MNPPEFGRDPLDNPERNSVASGQASAPTDSSHSFGGTSHTSQLVPGHANYVRKDPDWQGCFDNSFRPMKKRRIFGPPPNSEAEDAEFRATMESWDRLMAEGSHKPDNESFSNGGGLPPLGPPVLTTIETARDGHNATIDRIVSAFRRDEVSFHNENYTVSFHDQDHIPPGFRVRFLRRRRKEEETQYRYVYVTPEDLSADLLAVLRHQLQSYSIQLLEQEPENQLSTISKVPEQQNGGLRGFACAHCRFLGLQARCPLGIPPGIFGGYIVRACPQCIEDSHFCISRGTNAPYAGPGSEEPLPTILPWRMDSDDENSRMPGIANIMYYWMAEDVYDAYMQALVIQ